MHTLCTRLAVGLAVQLPTIALIVTCAPTVVARDSSLASTPGGASRLLHVAKHHRRRSLVARVAVLADGARIFTLVKPAALIARTHPIQRLLCTLSKNHSVLEGGWSLQHYLLPSEVFQTHQK